MSVAFRTCEVCKESIPFFFELPNLLLKVFTVFTVFGKQFNPLLKLQENIVCSCTWFAAAIAIAVSNFLRSKDK